MRKNFICHVTFMLGLCWLLSGAALAQFRNQHFDVQYECTSCYNPAALYARMAIPSTNTTSSECARVKLTGLLEVTKLTTHSSNGLTAIVFKNLALARATNTNEVITENLGEVQCFVLLDTPLQIKQFWFAAPVPPVAFHRLLIKTLVSYLQFGLTDLDAMRPSQMKVVQEENPIGRYQAGYSLLAATASTQTFQKRNLGYDAYAGASAESAARAVTPYGELCLVYDRSGQRVLEVGGETGETTVVEGQPFGRMDARFLLRHVESSNLREDARLQFIRRARANQQAARPLMAPEPEKERLLSDALGILTRTTPEKILYAVDNLTPTTNQSDLARQVWALAYAHPSASYQLGRRLINLTPDQPAFSLLVGALVRAGNESSQEALVEALRTSSHTEQAATLAGAIGSVSAPTPLAEKALFALVQNSSPEKRIAAGLALGAMARRLRETSPQRATRIVARIMRSFPGSSASEQQALIDMLGNAAVPIAFAQIAKASQSDDPQLRSSAVAALRHYPLTDTRKMLLTAMEKDLSTAVRVEAIAAFNQHNLDESLLGSLAAHYLNEPSSAARLALLQVMSNARKNSSVAKATIQSAAEHDLDSEVREFARRLNQ